MTASIRWSDTELGAAIDLPAAAAGRPGTGLRGHIPPRPGAAPLIQLPHDRLASSTRPGDVLESRADCLCRRPCRGFAQLDTLCGLVDANLGAGRFGQFDHWRSHRRPAAITSAPSPSPMSSTLAFAIVGELDRQDPISANVQGGLRHHWHPERRRQSERPRPWSSVLEDVDGIKLSTARYTSLCGHPTLASDSQPALQLHAGDGSGWQVLDLQLQHRPHGDLIKTPGGRKRKRAGADASETAVPEADGPGAGGCSTSTARGWRCSSCSAAARPWKKRKARSIGSPCFYASFGTSRPVIRDDPPYPHSTCSTARQGDACGAKERRTDDRPGALPTALAISAK